MAAHSFARDTVEAPRHAVVVRRLADESCGFLHAGDRREVRFARNVIARDELDELGIGSQVLFAEVAAATAPDAIAGDPVTLGYHPEQAQDPEWLGADDELLDMTDSCREV